MIYYDDDLVYEDLKDDLDEEYWDSIPEPEPYSIDDPTWFSINGDY